MNYSENQDEKVHVLSERIEELEAELSDLNETISWEIPYPGEAKHLTQLRCADERAEKAEAKLSDLCEKVKEIASEGCAITGSENVSCRSVCPGSLRFGQRGDEEHWCYVCQLREILDIEKASGCLPNKGISPGKGRNASNKAAASSSEGVVNNHPEASPIGKVCPHGKSIPFEDCDWCRPPWDDYMKGSTGTERCEPPSLEASPTCPNCDDRLCQGNLHKFPCGVRVHRNFLKHHTDGSPANAACKRVKCEWCGGEGNLIGEKICTSCNGRGWREPEPEATPKPPPVRLFFREL